MYNYPYAKGGLFNRLLGVSNFSWSGFLDGTQKTLGVINQALPIVNQVRPMISNAKTMFRIADEIRKPQNNIDIRGNNVNTVTNHTVNTTVNKPTFYI